MFTALTGFQLFLEICQSGSMGAQKLVSQNPRTVPVIDFSGLSDPIRRSAICAEVARACETVGFFQIVNSGIPIEVLDGTFSTCQEFFDLPLEEKLTLVPDLKENKPLPAFQLGYKHFPVLCGIENRIEEMIFRDYHMREGPDEYYTNGSTGDIDPTLNWWPTNPPSFRQKTERLLGHLGTVGDTLLDVFSESLGLPVNYLREVQHRNAQVPRFLNLHHYPKRLNPDTNGTGLMPHRDSSVFSIVSQGFDTHGLEIFVDGEWIAVLPQNGALIINVGDILQAWTNGQYKSNLHKVKSNEKAGRHSFAYFLFPAVGPDYIVKPIAKLIDETNPPTYENFSYLDYFHKKLSIDSVSLLETLEVACF